MGNLKISFQTSFVPQIAFSYRGSGGFGFQCSQDLHNLAGRPHRRPPAAAAPTPQRAQMPPRALQEPPSSPLTFDVPQVDPTRFRVQNIFLLFLALENEGRDNCKMLSKKGFQWRPKCAKCGQIVKRRMKIKGPENLHMEMTKQGETQALQSLIFESPPTRNRSFKFSRIVENVFQKAPEATRN